MYETHDKKALLLPNVTPADAGKVLAVDENGKLSLEEIGSGLPEVSVSDAGDVLTVNASGEWEAAPPSGGGGNNFIVHIYVDETTQDLAVRETYEEIKSALDAEKTVSGIFEGGGDVQFLSVQSYNSYEIQMCSSPTMTNRSVGSPAETITVVYFFISRNGITGDTVVSGDQRTGTFAATS